MLFQNRIKKITEKGDRKMMKKAIKKTAITMVLSCFLIFVILMSVVPVSVLASDNSAGGVNVHTVQKLGTEYFRTAGATSKSEYYEGGLKLGGFVGGLEGVSSGIAVYNFIVPAPFVYESLSVEIFGKETGLLAPLDGADVYVYNWGDRKYDKIGTATKNEGLYSFTLNPTLHVGPWTSDFFIGDTHILQGHLIQVMIDGTRSNYHLGYANISYDYKINEQPTLESSKISQSKAYTNDTVLLYYKVTNPNIVEAKFVLEVRLRDPYGNWITDTKNTQIDFSYPAEIYWYYKEFEIPATALPGFYDVEFSIWDESKSKIYGKIFQGDVLYIAQQNINPREVAEIYKNSNEMYKLFSIQHKNKHYYVVIYYVDKVKNIAGSLVFDSSGKIYKANEIDSEIFYTPAVIYHYGFDPLLYLRQSDSWSREALDFSLTTNQLQTVANNIGGYTISEVVGIIGARVAGKLAGSSICGLAGPAAGHCLLLVSVSTFMIEAWTVVNLIDDVNAQSLTIIAKEKSQQASNFALEAEKAWITTSPIFGKSSEAKKLIPSYESPGDGVLQKYIELLEIQKTLYQDYGKGEYEVIKDEREGLDELIAKMKQIQQNGDMVRDKILERYELMLIVQRTTPNVGFKGIVFFPCTYKDFIGQGIEVTNILSDPNGKLANSKNICTYWTEDTLAQIDNVACGEEVEVYGTLIEDADVAEIWMIVRLETATHYIVRLKQGPP